MMHRATLAICQTFCTSQLSKVMLDSSLGTGQRGLLTQSTPGSSSCFHAYHDDRDAMAMQAEVLHAF